MHVWMDIDGTLTDDADAPQIHPQYALGNAVLDILCEAIIRQQGCSREDAVARMRAFTQDLVFWDYPDFIVHFDLPVEETWRRIQAWHEDHIRVFEDAVALVHGLKRAGLPLHIISNNPLSGCLLKVQRAGLGSLRGSPWFGRVFCSNSQRGQKGQMEFWKRALAGAQIPPHEVIMVGNDPEEDVSIPRKAGVRHFVLVDRNGKNATGDEPGVLSVSSLADAEKWILNIKASER